jgi:hypothetical protein
VSYARTAVTSASRRRLRRAHAHVRRHALLISHQCVPCCSAVASGRRHACTSDLNHQQRQPSQLQLRNPHTPPLPAAEECMLRPLTCPPAHRWLCAAPRAHQKLPAAIISSLVLNGAAGGARRLARAPAQQEDERQVGNCGTWGRRGGERVSIGRRRRRRRPRVAPTAFPRQTASARRPRRHAVPHPARGTHSR